MGAKALDLTGKRFGRLVAVRDVGAERAQRLWECGCDCGATRVTTATALSCGRILSCGCLRREVCRENQKRRAG